MLTRAGTIALRALVELARSQGCVLSGPELAKRQELPEARLEQILLQLRQAQLIEARRGRSGSYRLSRAADDLSVREVLDAVGGRRQLSLELEQAEGVVPSCKNSRFSKRKCKIEAKNKNTKIPKRKQNANIH